MVQGWVVRLLVLAWFETVETFAGSLTWRRTLRRARWGV
jgi:trehalose utilization protein